VDKAARKRQKKTQERGPAMHRACHRQYAAQQDRELKRDQSPFGPILAPVTSSRTHMTLLYKFRGVVWDGSRFQLQYGAVVYNINLISFKNIFNLNNKQNDLSKCLLKAYNSSSTIFWST
jgi:hypothetical protein